MTTTGRSGGGTLAVPGPLRVIFALAAGPRLGFGHLVRARSLARALGVDPRVVIRGSAATKRWAAARGWQVVGPNEAAHWRRADVLVVDDPSPAVMRAWVRRARRAAIPVATVHDLGIGALASDLVIDGTVRPNRRVTGRFGTLHGPAFAILDPAAQALRPRVVRPARSTVLVALGGGQHAAAAARIARAIGERHPGLDLRVAAGFAAGRRPVLRSGHWINAPGGLGPQLAQARVAVVAGGVTLYEACALGVPVVAVALNRWQQVTIRGVARTGAAVDAGRLPARPTASFDRRIADAVAGLLSDPARRRSSAAGRRLVDGRGALRAAAAIQALVSAASSGRMDRVA